MRLGLLKRAGEPPAGASRLARGVCLEAAGGRLRGMLDLPPDPSGLILFASSRHLERLDPRQVHLAEALNERSLGTLLIDLLDSDDPPGAVADVELLTERLLAATFWVGAQPGAAGLPLGYVGSGRGSAAALSAAVLLGTEIGAVASRAGRPDLAQEDLSRVRAPTLLVADAGDPLLLRANAGGAARLRCPHRLRTMRVSGVEVGRWAAAPAICRWMEWHLGSPAAWEPRVSLG